MIPSPTRPNLRFSSWTLIPSQIVFKLQIKLALPQGKKEKKIFERNLQWFKHFGYCRFNTLAWGHATTEKPYGIIAGGMENGELELYDASAILDNKRLDKLD